MAQPYNYPSQKRSSNRRKKRNKRYNEQYQHKQNYNSQSHTESHPSTKPSSNDNLLVIDGSIMEGGGQILRNSVTLSAMMKQPIHITNIRGKRSNPGLRKQHSKGIELVANINRGFLEGNYVKSMDIKYYPSDKQSYLNTYTVDIETAGSVCLLVQTCIPLLLLSPISCKLICIGGTNASFAPQIDYYILVLKPMLKRLMNIDINIQCVQRGFFPKGGGKIILDSNPVKEHIPCFDLTKRGTICKIYGRVIIGGRGLSLAVGDSVVKGAMRELQMTFGKQIEIKIDIMAKHEIDSYSDGIGVVIVVETDSGCIFGGSSLKGPSKGRGKRGRYNKDDSTIVYEEIGRVAARELITDWKSTKGGCTDRWLQDQLIIFMALSKGRSRMATCAMELHTETAIHIAQIFTGVTFDVTTMKDGTVLIECDGIGYTANMDIKERTRKVKNVEQKDNDNVNDESNDNPDDDTIKPRGAYLNNRPSLF